MLFLKDLIDSLKFLNIEIIFGHNIDGEYNN